jgi:hypothetical protein
MRHKPTREQKAATHAAQAEDYQRLAQAVVEAIVQKRRDIIFKIAYFAELDPELPKGILIHKDEHYNWYRAKAYKMADFLHARGFLPNDAKGIVKSMRTVSNMLGEIDRLLAAPQQEFLRDDKIVDDVGILCDNVGSENEESK